MEQQFNRFSKYIWMKRLDGKGWLSKWYGTKIKDKYKYYQ